MKIDKVLNARQKRDCRFMHMEDVVVGKPFISKYLPIENITFGTVPLEQFRGVGCLVCLGWRSGCTLDKKIFSHVAL